MGAVTAIWAAAGPALFPSTTPVGDTSRIQGSKFADTGATSPMLNAM